MTTADHPDRAVADPIGLITDLIADVEKGLGTETVRAVVTAVAGGRAKSRNLARFLATRPAVLTDGRSPAPRAIGGLLIELRRAGASAIAPPACAECGKTLRTLQRQGQDWYCSVCGQADHRVHRLRQRPPSRLPGPQGPASLQDVSRHRRP